MAQLQAARGVAAMDTNGSHEGAGSATTATWVRDALVISDASARARVRLATALRDDLPRVGDQLLDGGSTVEHAAAAVAGTRGLDPTIVRDSEGAMCQLIAAADPLGRARAAA